jgi:lipase chaperone LimK
MSEIPERDSKLLRELKPVALERLCERILRSAAEIAAASGATNHQRYLKLYAMLQKQNREVAIAFDDHRRSTALPKIAQIHARGLFTEEEFARFSEETRKRVLALESLWPRQMLIRPPRVEG